ncbi:E3 ubiquitin-protein ligase TRIM38-like isoform X2 [Myotis daubentonii]|nr:E3 ubiquitin-protein ligase TRIM38-like isoform X2 [Myotis daubentonii]XP_059530409.1 E3 ubiquitin-protein ligase TRIM38-like isoform X2 [Myotis daubentonii]XP_059530410.1 E3 ubiquitin-protein ligase TRIM38-like isoform X2 [Myotis daubentonii]XP_059530411.1 E3 ubiquitin-protein ligase TRIM38-like isoform X2 [Myotis daubentonii]
MASASTSKKMREEATCSICLHLMAEPVSISCGHSYCQACLLGFMGLSSSSSRSQQSTFSFPGSQQSTFSSPRSQQSTFSFPGSQQSPFSFPGSQQSTFSFPGSQQSTFSSPRSQQSTFSFLGSQQSTFSFPGSQQSPFSFPGSQQSTFIPGSQQSTFIPGSQQSTFCFPQSQQDTQTFSCPQCRAPFQRGSLRPNKQLGSLIATLREQEQQQEREQELSCQEHGERLHLFCEDEGQLICWRCERDGRHKGHNTVLVEDVGPGYREKLQEAVRKLRKLEEECTNQKAFTVKQMAQWKEKVEAQRQKIQAEFQNLRSFLREEERSYLWRLESEEQRTLQRLRDSEADLGQQSRKLQSHIRELEERCQGSAQKLLQDVKGALSRSQAVRLETPEALVLEIETECEVPELYFDLRKHLRSHQVGVTLDPETAHPELILSQDQRQVTRGPQREAALSPQRFMASPCILGRQSFASGRRYFEVDVGEGTGWDVGVCLESVQRLGGTTQRPETGFWALRLCAQDGYVALTWPRTPLRLQERPLLVGVLLDCEVGLVSFYSGTSGSHMFTFPRASFPDVLRPYLQVYPYSPLFLPSLDE